MSQDKRHNPVVVFFACSLVGIMMYAGLSSSKLLNSGQSTSAPESAHPKKERPRLGIEAHTLLRGTIEVGPRSYYHVTFTVPTYAVEPKITGDFRARGGAGNDIRIVVGTTKSFDNWVNGHTARMSYSSNKITTDDLRVSLRAGEEYVLALDNSYSTFSSKSVETSIYLVYQQPVLNGGRTLGDITADRAADR